MSDKRSNLTDKEMEDLQRIVTDTLARVCTMADKHNIDRDSMLKYFADMLTAFTKITNIQNYKTNYTKADRIRNMSDEKLARNLCLLLDCRKCPTFKTCNAGSMCCENLLEWLQSEAE